MKDLLILLWLKHAHCSCEVCDYSAQSDDELKSHAIENEEFDNIQKMFDE